MSNRVVVAEFYRPPHGTTRIHSLTVIEDVVLHGGRPGIARNYYDVEWSRKYGYIFHQSGSGGGRQPVTVHGLHFVCGEAELKPEPCTFCDGHRRERKRRTRLIRKINATRQMKRLPRGIQLRQGEDLLDYLERDGIQQDAVYCSTCRDYLPGDDYNLCEHVWWCDQTGWYSTPSDRCKHEGKDCCGDPIPDAVSTSGGRGNE